MKNEKQSFQSAGDNQKFLFAIAIVTFGICGSLSVLFETWKAALVGLILFITFTAAAVALAPHSDPDPESPKDEGKAPQPQLRNQKLPPDHQFKTKKGIG